MEDEKIVVVRLDTDNVDDIKEFQRLWHKNKADVVFVPKNAKFIFEGNEE